MITCTRCNKEKPEEEICVQVDMTKFQIELVDNAHPFKLAWCIDCVQTLLARFLLEGAPVTKTEDAFQAGLNDKLATSLSKLAQAMAIPRPNRSI